MNKAFEYNGQLITFETEKGTTMVNATEMAKPFGKRPAKWLELPSAIAFLQELSNVRKSDNVDNQQLNIIDHSLIKTVKGGTPGAVIQGTWMHEDVAIEFARWLNPAFAIWCNDRIKELMKYGITATPTALDDILADPDTMIGVLTELKKERERSAIQQKELEKAAPKVRYVEEVLSSESTILTNVIAKELGMSAVILNRKLHEMGVIYKSGGTWVPYAKYQDKGYAKTKTHTYTDQYNQQRTSVQLVWTEKGRQFIHDLMSNRPKNKLKG